MPRRPPRTEPSPRAPATPAEAPFGVPWTETPGARGAIAPARTENKSLSEHLLQPIDKVSGARNTERRIGACRFSAAASTRPGVAREALPTSQRSEELEMVAFSNNRPSQQTLAALAMNRRRMLALGGLTAGAGMLAACGSNTGRSDDSGGVNLSQWYHQYGEPGTQQAAEKYAAAYEDATVTIQLDPGRLRHRALLRPARREGGRLPGRLRGPPQPRHGRERPSCPARRHPRRCPRRLHPRRPGPQHGRRQDLRRPHDRRPAVPVLPPPRSWRPRASTRPPPSTSSSPPPLELTTGDVKGLFLGNDDSATKLFQYIVSLRRPDPPSPRTTRSASTRTPSSLAPP